MMYEQSDAVQNTECSSPERLGILPCVCVCIHADVQVCKYMCVFGDVWLALTHSRLVIYTAT